MVISELKGSMANLSEEEDKELKRTDIMNSDIRRDFSVIHSKQMKKNHLFLGPARFVNVSTLSFLYVFSSLMW
jgi:histone-lysine N-methyltransferase SUV420H